MNGPPLESRHPGNANPCFNGFNAHDILSVLQPLIAASTGSACTSGITEPSHVLKAIGLTTDESEASIRFSLGFDTSDDDIDQAITLIERALSTLSEFSNPSKDQVNTTAMEHIGSKGKIVRVSTQP